MRLAIGVDAGGTSTRAWVVDDTGRVRGTGTAGGANPNSHPPEAAARAMVEAITTAMSGSDPAEVRAWVIGMAGRSKLTDPRIAAVFEREWAGLGFVRAGRPRLVSDAVAAFVSATPEPDGTVLVAGTGSIAGRIRDREMVSTVGGYGWLLGDEGSGFWLGRQAVRTALDVLNGNHPPSSLADAVLAEAGIEKRSPDAAFHLITAVNAEPPVRLARYAPLVSAAHADGDPAATEIVERAATLLAEMALAARDDGETTPVVLVGSVLGPASPVGEAVRAALRTATDAPVLGSDNGVLGAAWLAALDAFGPDIPRPKTGTVS
ncbi:N-acetylglucosamine kinase [Saccharomonospora glauca]|jgi:glucosamine kinase|uniref:Putative N-acetylglucosamine kinase n=1 Tax=Saccharomonospora glauca K62 TaxID=928724 RepID=I1D6W8_9PSEU|nr:BadF/BadG/BcrA/BcrD ATPase family protein [Saccharomonospora glauca]EIF00693.1 putative N-acetylglucosamine kinase [Saccharomonospora glauca K62]